MKKIIFILTVLISFSACNKDDGNDSFDNRSELIIGLWDLETINGVLVGVDTPDPIDFQREFKTNNDCVFYSDSNISSTSTYSFNSEYTTINFENTLFNILSLSNDEMTLSFITDEFLGPDGLSTAEIVQGWAKIE